MPENESLKRAKEILGSVERQKREAQGKSQQQERAFISAVAAKAVDALKPALNQIASQARVTKADMEAMVSKIKVETHTPDVILPEISVPKAEVTVRSPKITIPDVVMPDEMNVRGFVQLMGVDLNNPLPVQLRTADGNPLKLMENLTQIVQGGGGGAARQVKIINTDDIGGGTQYAEGDTAASITGTASMGEADSNTLYPLRLGAGHDSAQALRVTHATDATVSVNIVSGSSAGTQYEDGDTASSPTGTLSMGDTGEESNNIYALATAEGATGSNVLRVNFATDSIASVNIVSGSSSGTEYADGATASPATGVAVMGDTGEESGNIFVLATASGVTGSSVLRVVQAVDSISSVNIAADASGGVEVVQDTAADLNVTEASAADILTSVQIMDDWDESNRAAVNLISSQAGVAADQGEADARTLRVVHAGDVGISTVATLSATDNAVLDNIDTNTSNTATAVQVMDDWDATHDSAIGADGAVIMAEARTTNPTAVGNGDAVRLRADDTGRPVTRPVQARDLMQTAYATISSDATTTVLAGAASTFHDLVYVMGANQSDGAVTMDFASATNGGTVFSLEIPANATNGMAPAVPVPQDVAADTWVVKFANSDTTGTTVDISALFSKEV